MSLETLANLRRMRKRPHAVNVVLGKPPDWFGDDPREVVIAPTDKPAFMDLRPLIGVSTYVVELQRDDNRFSAVIEALQVAGAHIDGIVSAAGACGSSPEHERALVRLRELLCM